MSIAAQTNRSSMLRTIVLLGGLTALLVVIGGLLGGTAGVVLAALLGVGLNMAAYWWSGPMALRASRAQPLPAHAAPQLRAVVSDLAARAGIPEPTLWLIPSEQPNAFATGRNPEHAAIAVTEGLLSALPPHEVAGVVAHEMAHIKNRDILIASVGAMIAGAITAIAQFLQFSWLFGGDEESPLGVVGVIAIALLAPLAALVLQMAVSRSREYAADATGAELLGDAEPLAGALERLERLSGRIPLEADPAHASLYIVNPLAGGQIARLLSTHPPLDDRIRRLRALARPAPRATMRPMPA